MTSGIPGTRSGEQDSVMTAEESAVKEIKPVQGIELAFPLQPPVLQPIASEPTTNNKLSPVVMPSLLWHSQEAYYVLPGNGRYIRSCRKTDHGPFTFKDINFPVMTSFTEEQMTRRKLKERKKIVSYFKEEQITRRKSKLLSYL